MSNLKKPKQYDDDDGRVIVNMDVPGMRWHNPNKMTNEATESSKPGHKWVGSQVMDLTRKELRQVTWSALLAGLTIALVFSATWILFTLFATQVWFR
jgi:hypothetical protein